MASRLGDRFLPESVVSRRRQFRQRLQNARRPIQQFRERNVPGPNIIGKAENRLADVRTRLTNREGIVDRIRARRSGGSSSGGSSGGSSGSGSSGNTVEQMT